MASQIQADYLIIGAGAMGMAFADTLLSDTQATFAIVDRYARPGGHWTTAYPYVRLHQPSQFYGVNSRNLGEDRLDQVGWNKGLSELASVDEVTAYYGIVMDQTFLPSGRVQYFPLHEYTGEGQWRSNVTGKSYQVGKQTIIVDATFMKVKVPSMGPPPYKVGEGVELVTPNDLPKATRPYAAYTVVGAGKTGIDASSINAINGSVMEASSPEDLFLRLEKHKQLIRMTDQVWPSMFRCATVSLAELEQVQKIGNVIRQGRVVSLEANKVTMENGDYQPGPDTLYIDCSADALAKLEPVPVFRGKQITLQSVRYCQQVFSAAFIAHVEATYDDEKLKNDLCHVVPHPDESIDWFIVTLQSHRNGPKWSAQPKTAAWLAQARLDWFGKLLPPAPSDPEQVPAFWAAFGAQVQALCEKLEILIGQLPEKDAARAKAQIAR
ncbi:uncharacterized protein MYCGRDRAFT_42715 [Zymoseptoria tritici IPO323]|uniref:FAD/NAD(P)-binding domain-containing protein n=1 Tax=Zymoseptoria tritici (strain CBS 115943 / IPO323) TaxID=336722 RepID=F9XAI3_ZYMTI|nr:uncharacterized protein MYCGRDRAFT_42715 [Zymoseptoria tritici IPO323]EGP86998.1 hypothetical protein MYCGRDRAFT_42715 [Zymoseptoria tritici IPO323]